MNQIQQAAREQLKDRRDYRQALIHRLNSSRSRARKAIIEMKLGAVEHQIAELTEAAALKKAA